MRVAKTILFNFFRSKFVLIKLVLPQAAQFGIKFLSKKNSNAAPPRGTCLKDTLLRMEAEKASGGNQAHDLWVLLRRPMLHRSATIAAHPI